MILTKESDADKLCLLLALQARALSDYRDRHGIDAGDVTNGLYGIYQIGVDIEYLARRIRKSESTPMTTNDEIAQRMMLFFADAGVFTIPASLVRGAVDHALPPVTISEAAIYTTDEAIASAQEIAALMPQALGGMVERAAAATVPQTPGHAHMFEDIDRARVAGDPWRGL